MLTPKADNIDASASTVHACSLSALRNIWSGMIRRCTVPHTSGYARYGGRGIRVCERWMASFDAFAEDMGARPSPEHTLDRINNDGHYEPGNVRWASAKEQQRNKRVTRWVPWRGEMHRVADLAEQYKIDIHVLASRVQRGWSVERALGIDMAPVAPPPYAHPEWKVTERQFEVLEFIYDHIQGRGCAPTLREIGRAFEIRSTNGIRDCLVSLERKGKLSLGGHGLARVMRLTTVGERLVLDRRAEEEAQSAALVADEGG